MSTKHLRRYLQETESRAAETGKKKTDNDCVESKVCSESETETENETTSTFVSNRYAFLGESGEGGDEGSGEIEETSVEKRTEKKVMKKKRKGKKKVHRTDTDNDLENIPKIMVPQQKSQPKQNNVVFECDLFKIDSRMLNVENELRSMLGRRSTDTSGQHGRMVFGKIVKKKPTWPEVKNVGLSMVLDRTDGDTVWFRFTHNVYYREMQQKFWVASERLDHNYLSHILAECPYHLDSLLVMAELFRQQEDYQLSRDLIERGIFCCENVFAARFQLSNFEHHIDYDDFENRAFFLLLHRHMRNLLDRHCFRTAFHVAKLIYRLDPVSDPLAIMLTIDSVALKAREYNYLIVLYDTLQISRNLNRLPNFAYSVALARFFMFRESGNTEEKERADLMLATAIRHFPTVLLKLLDAMNVQPDPAVENNQRMSALAYERESDGLKLLISIYVKLASSVWLEDPSILSWLETVTTVTVSSFDDFKEELAEWEEMRKKYYLGIPRNIQRHAYLWEVMQNEKWMLTDPAPPYNSRATYERIAYLQAPNRTFLASLLHSFLPDHDQAAQLRARVEEALNALRRVLAIETPGGTDGAAEGTGDSDADVADDTDHQERPNPGAVDNEDEAAGDDEEEEEDDDEFGRRRRRMEHRPGNNDGDDNNNNNNNNDDGGDDGGGAEQAEAGAGRRQ